MLDIQGITQERIEKMNEDIDNPYRLNGFSGTFAITDHRKIPEVLLGFLQHHFGIYRLKRVSLDKINEALNEIWEGPGSLAKVLNAELEMKLAGKDVKFTAADIAATKAISDEDDSGPVADAGAVS
jgi:hypothetical protein